MPYIRRRTRGRRSRGVWLAWPALLTLTLGAYWLSPWRRNLPEGNVSSGAPAGATFAARPAGQRPARPVYRYSIIPGGAYSVSELRQAERRDPVIAAHYAVFDHDNLRIAANSAARGVYVSYRVGDVVYWTRRRVHLAAAEDLITDGENQARARCGNRVSDTPRGPMSAFQPREAALDESEGMLVIEAPPESPPSGSMLAPEIFPPLALLPLAGLGPAPFGPEVEPNPVPLIPFVPPGGETLAPEWPPLPPVIGEPETSQDSPEPETGLLAAAGVLAVAGLAVWRMRRGRAA